MLYIGPPVRRTRAREAHGHTRRCRYKVAAHAGYSRRIRVFPAHAKHASARMHCDQISDITCDAIGHTSRPSRPRVDTLHAHAPAVAGQQAASTVLSRLVLSCSSLSTVTAHYGSYQRRPCARLRRRTTATGLATRDTPAAPLRIPRHPLVHACRPPGSCMHMRTLGRTQAGWAGQPRLESSDAGLARREGTRAGQQQQGPRRALQLPRVTRAPRRVLGSGPATPITLLACIRRCDKGIKAELAEPCRTTDPGYTEN